MSKQTELAQVADTITVNSGNVGIGTSSPAWQLHVKSTSNAVVQIEGASSAGSFVNFGDPSDTDVGQIGYDHTSNYMRFKTNDTERMRIDSSGNLLVGKTSDDNTTAGAVLRSTGQISGVRDGNIVGKFNRLSSNGDIVEFRKDGTTVGSIGNRDADDIFINTAGGTGSLSVGGTEYYAWSSGAIYPWTDNARDLGGASNRFDDVFATNGTIQTSDRNEKQDIAELSAAEQRVAVAAKGLLRKFRWKSSVAEKGDEARTHFGIIAQDLQAAFAAEGLDAGDYAMFINSTWTDEETGEERSRMGVRYSELLAFIIAAI